MQQEIAKLQQIINTTERENFSEKYYGKVFTGDITLMFDQEAYTLSFHRGTVIALEKGVPNTGVDLGIAGDDKAWTQFYTHKSLSVATNRGNENNLRILGSPLRTRQNFNPLAYLIRVLANIVEGGKTA